ncbi:MAG: hypothetical protein RIR46_1093 [Actinomycetota bacterium]|jgi:hypothetical protein
MTTPAKTPVKRAPAAKPAARTTVRSAAKPAAKAAVAVEVAAKPDFTKRYKMLTGIDNSEFCAKVRLHLDNGYALHGSPVMAFNSLEGKMYVGQAVVLKKLPAKKKAGKKK